MNTNFQKAANRRLKSFQTGATGAQDARGNAGIFSRGKAIGNKGGRPKRMPGDFSPSAKRKLLKEKEMM